MSLRLRLLNLILRRTVKPRLARLRGPHQMRAGLARNARRLPGPPAGVRFDPEAITPAESLRVARTTLPDSARPGAAPRLLWCHGPWDQSRRVILYFHGGAYIAGAPETHRPLLWPLARAAGAALVAPAYAKAPERPFPAAVEDAAAAYAALLALGWPPDRIALAGDSAGGGLAFGALVEIQRRGLPAPGAALGFSPWADLSLSSPSLRRLARREAMLPVGRIAEAADAYLAGADPTDPRASPVYAQLENPPASLIQAGDREVLRDDAVRLATALREAGADVRLELWPRAPHAFQFFQAFVPESHRAVARAGAFLQRALEPEVAPASQTATPANDDNATVRPPRRRAAPRDRSGRGRAAVA